MNYWWPRIAVSSVCAFVASATAGPLGTIPIDAVQRIVQAYQLANRLPLSHQHLAPCKAASIAPQKPRPSRSRGLARPKRAHRFW